MEWGTSKGISCMFACLFYKMCGLLWSFYKMFGLIFFLLFIVNILMGKVCIVVLIRVGR